MDVDHLGLRDDPVPFTGEGLPAVVGHERIERQRGGEPQELDFQRLPGGAAAPGTLHHPPAVLGNHGQDAVLIGDQAVLGTRTCPQQNTQGQVHGNDRPTMLPAVPPNSGPEGNSPQPTAVIVHLTTMPAAGQAAYRARPVACC